MISTWFYAKAANGKMESSSIPPTTAESDSNLLKRKRMEEFTIMEELVGFVNEVQNVLVVCSSSEIKLPEIVVVGSQSAGKSSVLEQIVGKSFLPRGTGIVTRCPLVLQLVHAPDGTEAYATFQHDDTKRYTDFDLIRKEIEEKTVKLAGTIKNICHTPIKLKICSPSLLDLTLVDLPGLMKVPVGDQPANIEEQTRSLILKYITNPNSIILAVTAANTDMATSDSLKIAKEVDPQGARTLAVLTKLDLMDQGTDAWEMLLGKVIPVKLGIIGVVNRSQQDINDDKTIEENVKEEAEFFKKNYERIAALHGSQYLARKVQSILINHIKKCMPELKKNISEAIKSKQEELLHYPKSSLDSYNKQLHDLIFKFTQIYTSSIKGFSSLSMIQADELLGGARVRDVFKNSFAQDLHNINPLNGLDKSTVLKAIQNSNGMNEAIYLPLTAFDLLAKRQVEQFKKPSLKCVELICQEMCKTVESCLEDESLLLEHYPKLKTALGEIVTDLIQNCLPKTNESIENFMKVQTSYINTSHPDFVTNTTKSVEILFSEKYDSNRSGNVKTHHLCLKLPINSNESTDEDSVQYALMKKCLESYMSIVSNIVEDTVQKFVIHHLVHFVLDKLHYELVEKLVNNENHIDLMLESPETTKKRSEIEDKILELEKVEEILKTISIKTTKVMKL